MTLDKLKIPCAYQGGKSRLAKEIIDVIFKENEVDDETKFYDLCCGSGAISIELIKRGVSPFNIIMVDKSPWGLFWEMVGNGTFSLEVFKFYIEHIPKELDKIQEYVNKLSKSPANDGLFNNLVYKYLILQASSFGSKAIWEENNEWKTNGFRSYWLPSEKSKRRSPVNPMMPMPDSLFDRVEQILFNMENVKGINTDVKNIIKIPDNSIIYIDPPYKNTTGYGYNFDIDSLLSQFNSFIKLNKPKTAIYVSEGYKMNEEATLLSSKRKKGGISGERNSYNEEWLNKFKYN